MIDVQCHLSMRMWSIWNILYSPIISQSKDINHNKRKAFTFQHEPDDGEKNSEKLSSLFINSCRIEKYHKWRKFRQKFLIRDDMEKTLLKLGWDVNGTAIHVNWPLISIFKSKILDLCREIIVSSEWSSAGGICGINMNSPLFHFHCSTRFCIDSAYS